MAGTDRSSGHWAKQVLATGGAIGWPLLEEVDYSGGICSFFAAKRVIDKFGKDNVVLLFADTEDEALYRFLDETSVFLAVSITKRVSYWVSRS